MAYVKKVTKIVKLEDGEVKVQRLLSDYTLFYNVEGDVIQGFKTAEDLYAIVTPNFCKQLKMMTKICHYNNYLHMIEDARIFCSDVYHTVVAEGLIRAADNKRAVRLHKDNGTIVTYALENGCPQLINEKSSDWTFIRRLTLNKESKMSKKLWSTTDWLLRK